MSTRRGRDAVVIGAGHNGLVAANLLVDAGWDVQVLEEQPRAGGAVFSDRSLHPDFVTDWYSAFYPLGYASPVLSALGLAEYGLQWSHAPAVLAHVLPDDRCALLSRDLDTTASSLEEFGAGDGQAWARLVDEFDRIHEPLLDALFTPFPPVRAGLRLARRFGAADLLRFARFAVTPARRTAAEIFTGEGGPLLIAGNALHTDLTPEAAGGTVFGWLLAMLGQRVGFPVPVGGSGAIVDALAARLLARGGRLQLNAPVSKIEISDNHVTGVLTADGTRVRADAVLADVGAPMLYRELVGPEHLPSRLLSDLQKFQWDSPTLKIDWALSAPIPWTASAARSAGTVHLGVDLNGLTRYSADLATGQVPRDPFLLLGQMTTSDATRSPAGSESAWAYTHLPEGVELTSTQLARHVTRVERVIEARAPGFGDSVLARRVQSPADLQATDANLVHGAVSGGTAAFHQQLFFRPIPGLGRAETPVDGLYLASAAAHPGGGVHGGPGANAARAALSRAGITGRAHRVVIGSLLSSIYRPADAEPAHRQSPGSAHRNGDN